MSFRKFIPVVLLMSALTPSLGHVPVASDPFTQKGCSAGLTDLDNSFAVLGALIKPAQVDYVCFDGAEGERLRAATLIPLKAAYEEPNDVMMILVGPGLPPPSRTVPDGLVDGLGAVFAETREGEGPFPRRTVLGKWHGPRLDVELPADGSYQIRVYSPSKWMGEYILTTTGNDPASGTGDLADTPMPTPGDINLDGKVNANDAILALVVALDVEPIDNSFALNAGDVAPPADPDALLFPGDGVIDLADVTRILRRALGLDAWEEWPL